MADLGTAVDSFDIYQEPYVTIDKSLVGPLQGQQSKMEGLFIVNAPAINTTPQEKATPGQRIYGTFIPYP